MFEAIAYNCNNLFVDTCYIFRRIHNIFSGTVRRLNYITKEDEEDLFLNDIIRMCSKREQSGYNDISLKRYKDCLVLLLDADVDEYVYLCPMNGNMRTDCIDVNDLFPAENQNGLEEEIV